MIINLCPKIAKFDNPEIPAKVFIFALFEFTAFIFGAFVLTADTAAWIEFTPDMSVLILLRFVISVVNAPKFVICVFKPILALKYYLLEKFEQQQDLHLLDPLLKVEFVSKLFQTNHKLSLHYLSYQNIMRHQQEHLRHYLMMDQML